MKSSALVAAAALFCLGLTSGGAQAAVAITAVNADLTAAPYTINYDGGSITFSASGDIFNPVSVRTSANAGVSSFGGFLGIPVAPTSDFVDRGVVMFGQGYGAFSAFTSTTEVPYSNGQNFIGLDVMNGGATYYGFAYTDNDELVSYGFQTSPGVAITATTAVPVPEPATWGLMVLGVGMLGLMMRSRRYTRAQSAGLVSAI